MTAQVLERLVSETKACRAELLAYAETLTADSGAVVEVKPADLAQMVGGFMALLMEGLEGRGTETRTQFLETVYPALVAGGEDRRRLMMIACKFHYFATALLVRRVPAPMQGPATEWLAEFLGQYTADMALVVLRGEK